MTIRVVWGSGGKLKKSLEARGQGNDELGAGGDSGDDTRYQGATASHDHNFGRLGAGITGCMRHRRSTALPVNTGSARDCPSPLRTASASSRSLLVSPAHPGFLLQPKSFCNIAHDLCSLILLCVDLTIIPFVVACSFGPDNVGEHRHGLTCLHTTVTICGELVEHADLGMVYLHSTAFHWSMSQVTRGAIEVMSANTVERVLSVVLMFVGLLVWYPDARRGTSEASPIRRTLPPPEQHHR